MRARCSGGFRSPLTRAEENNAKGTHGNHDRIGNTVLGASGLGAPTTQQPSPSDAPITIREMMEAGVHFGHQTKRWNPKMQSFIFGARNGIHIIDLQQTVRAFKRAYNFLVQNVAQGHSVLFVGTKKQAQEVMREDAERAGQFYVTNRWLGGTLTNFKSVKGSIDRLHAIEKMADDGTFERMTKKEVLGVTREREKLEKSLGGIKSMTELPGAVFIVDLVKEHIAVDRGAQAGDSDRRDHRHQLRSRPDRLPDPGQRRRDPRDQAVLGQDRRRLRPRPEGAARARQPAAGRAPGRRRTGAADDPRLVGRRRPARRGRVAPAQRSADARSGGDARR